MNRDRMNQIFGKEYDNFRRTMIRAAEFEELPVMLEITHPSGITIDDCKELAEWILEDTGLDVSFEAVLCQACKEMHLLMTVDYLENDEEE